MIMEPYHEYDAYMAARDERYKQLIDGKTCMDCGKCALPDFEGWEGIGWCRKFGEFEYDDQTVAEIGCEHFEVR